MISIVDRYFSLNRTLLLIIGLWPYKKSKFVGLQIICIFSILITCIIFQLTTIVSSTCSTEDIIKVLSTAFAFSNFVIKYNSFYINSETIKNLMEKIQHVYNDLRDSNEIAIAEEYGNNAKQYTVMLTKILICSLSVFMSTRVWLEFSDIVLSTNVSRSHHLQISTEYFIDQQRYFYLPYFHINATFTIGCVVICGTGSLLIAYLQHVCGMFKIASYRIKRAIHTYTSKNLNTQKEILIYKDLIRAVDIHRNSITFSYYFISRFQISFMFLIVTGVLTLSLNIFRIFQIVSFQYNTEEFMIRFLIIFICFLYMFLSNLVGQQIIDHNNYIFVTAYEVQWYVTPLPIQRLILIILQRGIKSFGLKVGGLFVASLERFTTLINASISYFTIIYSTRL